ncbi:hypothetical protein SynRCC2555_00267 [Synechococcus sp. WH 8101]|uniref:hypothetical protein n=1 Tax=Synechococcus sp. WH 8101 TaxID=59932 RepID=UPI00164BB578|nr:hypothetical protein [Synechococcus sp. WH 8101]QNI44074.1 hypothetical protein SynRCC2555_00266 [Synechococcus sp. WH 8101]QNI44075.1 hypothetical protein SynRCC2555_00267 [Synechococcus sp. WH 8101]
MAPTGNSTLGTGDGATGILLQSIGGGGGQGGSITGSNATTNASNTNFSFGGQVSLAGEGGAGGSGGSVQLGSSSLLADLGVQTVGDNAIGVFLQSVGGGGGVGGSVNSAAAAGGNLSASFAMGGSGGNGGSASNVNLYADGTFLTAGMSSHGILLQSVGGGGGQGGSVTSNASSEATSANSSFSFGAHRQQHPWHR